MKKSEQYALVKECRASGMKATEWCVAQVIDYKRYASWATNLNKEEKQPQSQQWAELKVIKEEQNINSEIKLNCGKWNVYVSSNFNPTLLSNVLKVVGELC